MFFPTGEPSTRPSAGFRTIFTLTIYQERNGNAYHPAVMQFGIGDLNAATLTFVIPTAVRRARVLFTVRVGRRDLLFYAEVFLRFT